MLGLGFSSFAFWGQTRVRVDRGRHEVSFILLILVRLDLLSFFFYCPWQFRLFYLLSMEVPAFLFIVNGSSGFLRVMFDRGPPRVSFIWLLLVLSETCSWFYQRLALIIHGRSSLFIHACRYDEGFLQFFVFPFTSVISCCRHSVYLSVCQSNRISVYVLMADCF